MIKKFFVFCALCVSIFASDSKVLLGHISGPYLETYSEGGQVFIKNTSIIQLKNHDMVQDCIVANATNDTADIICTTKNFTTFFFQIQKVIMEENSIMITNPYIKAKIIEMIPVSRSR